MLAWIEEDYFKDVPEECNCEYCAQPTDGSRGWELRQLVPLTAHAEELMGHMDHGAHFRERPSINRPDCVDVWYTYTDELSGAKHEAVYSYGPAYPWEHFRDRHTYPTKCGCDSQGRYILYVN